MRGMGFVKLESGLAVGLFLSRLRVPGGGLIGRPSPACLLSMKRFGLDGCCDHGLGGGQVTVYGFGPLYPFELRLYGLLERGKCFIVSAACDPCMSLDVSAISTAR